MRGKIPATVARQKTWRGLDFVTIVIFARAPDSLLQILNNLNDVNGIGLKKSLRQIMLQIAPDNAGFAR